MAMNRDLIDTIINQMGGMGTLRAFVNARDFVGSEKGVMFKFSGSRKYNIVKIDYNCGLDLYEVEFIKVHGANIKSNRHEMIYADMLVELFENETGLYLHF